MLCAVFRQFIGLCHSAVVHLYANVTKAIFCVLRSPLFRSRLASLFIALVLAGLSLAAATTPTITSFTPTSGAAGTTVTLTGTNFTGATAVKFNGTVTSSYTVVSATLITAVAPTGVTTGKLSVTTAGGTNTSSSSFSVVADPTISCFTPISGTVGTTVTLTGTAFTGATAVKFNGTSASSFSVTNATTITAVAPTGVTTGKLSVTTPGGTATSSSSFTVVAAPTITSFSPTSGSVGSTVTLTGTNFTGATAVKFNGTAATSFTVVSATSITAVAPTGVTTGILSVTTAGGTATSSSSFTVVAAPTITSFTPASGAAGTTVTLTGMAFTGAAAVKFNGTAATSYTVVSATSITAVAPTGVTTGKLSVTTAGGIATSSSSFTVVFAPTITSFMPPSGAAGTTVTLTGTNFTSTTVVKFNGTAASSYTVVSATSITAVAPMGVTTGTLSVTAPGGTATSSSSFTVVAAPTITSFTPTSGSVGSTVTLTGTNFTSATAVKFNSTVATSFAVVSATSITAVAPTGVTTGTLSVTTPSGTATSLSSFTVVPAPTISAFTAAKTPITAGTGTTLTGTFTGGTGAVDNGVDAVTSGTVVPVTPAATTTYTLTVTGAGGATATKQATVTVVPTPTQPVITGPANVTANQAGYKASVATQTGCIYAWALSSGTITAGSTTNQITFTPKLATIPSLSTARTYHTATLLSTGKVLLAGGSNSSGTSLSTAEAFDPTAKTFSKLSASMTSPRAQHTATLLSTGKVLIAGGCDSTGLAVASAELYDPTAGIFTAVTGTMSVARVSHTATLLSNGKVLLAGGYDNEWNVLASADLFDPTTGTFSPVSGLMVAARANYTATLLSNGQVLMAGGWGTYSSLASTEIFDPSSGSFIPGALMASARAGQTATLLLNGMILLAGGYDNQWNLLASADLLNPAVGTSTLAPGVMNNSRAWHTATLQPNGIVFLAGGCGLNGYLASAEYFDPSTDTFSLVVGSMSSPKEDHTATLLANGQILLAAGNYYDANNNFYALATADLFNPSIGSLGGASLSCTLANAAGTSSTPGILNIAVLPVPTVPILTVPPGVITGGTGYSASIPSQAGCIYAWTITNGTITHGQNAAVVTFNAGSVSPITLSCSVTNAAGTAKTGTATVAVWPANVTLSPAAVTIAPGGQQVFTANQPVTWYPVGGTITYNSTTATFTAAESGFNLNVGTYSLTAISKADPGLMSTAQNTVWIPGAPVINQFTASSATTHAGMPVTLNWTVTDATTFYIVDSNNRYYSIVPTDTSLVVTPTQNTTYGLAATNSLGTVGASVTVTVDLIPTANLSASVPSVNLGGNVQLTPTFSNGTGRIDPGGLVAQIGVPLQVQINGSTAYALTVTNPYGVTATSVAWVDGIGPGAFLPNIPMLATGLGSEATCLRNGGVLVRGLNESNFSPRGYYLGFLPAQIFDPVTGAFQSATPLGNDRAAYTATLCADGRVLFYGGFGNSSTLSMRPDYELFDPVTKTIATFTDSTNPQLLRIGHQATLLTDGTILITGGNIYYSPDSAVLVDINASLSSGTAPMVHATGPMSVSRENHSAIRLMDGRVLVAGGVLIDTATGVQTPLTSAEIYDPVAGIWSLVGSLRQQGDGVSPVLMPDGRVNFGGKEVFDPSTLTFTNLPSPYIGFPGFGPASLMLQDGRILMGGVMTNGGSLMFYDPKTIFCSTTSSWGNFFDYAGQLPDGTVLSTSFSLLPFSGQMSHLDPQARLTIQPAVGHANVGLPLSMNATGAAAAQGVTWGATSGSITPSGQFVSASSGQVVVTAVAADGTKATVWVDVHPAVKVLFGPVSLPGNGAKINGVPVLNAAVPITIPVWVLNSPDQRVTWSVLEGSAAGAITTGGIFTGATAGTWHVVATSVVDPTQSATFALTLSPPISLSVSPATIAMNPGDTVLFTANESTGENYANWVSNEVSCGAGTTYTYVAPMMPGTYTLTATSTLDPAKSASAVITVVPITSFSITPSNPSIVITNLQSFKAFVTTSLGTRDVTGKVTWNCAGGTFSPYYWAYGQFTASTTPGTYALQATLNGTTLSSNTTINVIPVDSFFLSPSRYVLAPWESIPINPYIKSSLGTQIAYSMNPTWTCTGGLVDYIGDFTGQGLGTYTVQATISGTTTSATTKMMVVSADSFTTNEGGTQTYRNGFSMTRLLDGRILIAGGGNNTAEIYDPTSKTFSAVAATMLQVRVNHSAILLPNGKVLIVGGVYDTSQPIMAELFDPSTQTFSATNGAPLYRRVDLSMTLLPSGMVLVAGADGYSNKSLEVYDSNTGLFTPAGYLNNPFSVNSDASVLLSDGRVLFMSASSGLYGADSGEVFDFKTRISTLTPATNVLHQNFTLIQASDGKVWVLGGTFLNNSYVLVTEYFDPNLNQFILGPSPQISDSQFGYGVTELVDGSDYLFENEGYTGDCFYPGTGLLDVVHPIPVGNAGYFGKATLLPTGDVLRVGYYSGSSAPRGSTLIVYDTTPNAVILPRHITLVAGRTWPFCASSTGLGSKGFTWSIQEGIGSVTAQGVFTAPYTAGTYHLVATSIANSSIQATAIVDVIQDMQVTVAPALVQLAPGGVQKFTADVVGSTNAGVSWSTTGGTVLPDGTYTAPAVAGLYTLTATSLADETRSAMATIEVGNGGGSLPTPIISSFLSDTTTVELGQPANLSWNVVGAYMLTLIGGGNYLDVTGQSGMAVRPTATTQYQLRASNPAGYIYSQAITINVSTMSVTIAISPTTATVYAGQSMGFGFSLAAPTNRMVWTCSGGSITQSGAYTAPPVPGTYTVTVASVDDSSKTASATVTVTDVQLQLTPNSSVLDPGQTLQFGHNYNGPSGSSMVWSCSGGMISQSGLYTAPTTTGSYTVSLYSTAEPSLIRQVAVSVSSPLVQVTPSTAFLAPGGNQKFQVLTRSGTVAWSVVEPNGGTIAQDGTYMAPSATGAFTVKAVSSVDPSQYGTARVTVSTSGNGASNSGTGNTGATITLSTGNLSLDAGTYYPFQAIVAGAPDTSVTWAIQNNPVEANIDGQGNFMSSRHGAYTVVATSVADPTATTSVTIYVVSALHTNDTPLTSMRGYTVTALDNGLVLIAGGTPVPPNYDQATTTYSSNAWLYDPVAKTYTPAGNLLTARCDHHAVKLQDGRVLIAGGFAHYSDPWEGGANTQWNGSPYGHEYPFAEIYDPVSGTFSALPNRLVGPLNWPDSLCHPGTFGGPGLMCDSHDWSSRQQLLPSGQVWFSGGVWGWANYLVGGLWDNTKGEGTEVFDPSIGLFSPASTLSGGSTWNLLSHHAVALLPDGCVFTTRGLILSAIGPLGWPARAGRNVIIFDSAANTTQELTQALQVGRLDASVTTLPDGRLLLVGGGVGKPTQYGSTIYQDGGTYNNAGDPMYDYYQFDDTASAEIFDPTTMTSTLVPGNLAQARRGHAAILLPTGKVMIVGGVQHVGNNTAYPNLIEVFDPDTGQFSIMDHLDYGLTEPQLALLSTGSVFIAGQNQASMEAPVTKAGVGANKLKAADVGPQSPSLAIGSAVNGEIGHLYCVVVTVWKANVTLSPPELSVGHVFVGNPDLSLLLSQFPIPVSFNLSTLDWSGPLVPLDWKDTVIKEQRGPDAIFKILLPNQMGFLAGVEMNSPPNCTMWNSTPTSLNETNCTVSAYQALTMGGLPLGAMTSTATPNGLLECLNNVLVAQGLAFVVGFPSATWWIQKIY